MSGTTTDLTERKQAEAALLERELRWEFALAAAGAGVLDWNIATGEMQFSDRWLALTGYSREAVAPRLESLTALVHPEDLSQAMADVQEVLGGGKAVHCIEHRLKHQQGHWIWVQAQSLVTAWNDQGEPLRMVGTHLDITERKQAEAALRGSEGKYRTLAENLQVGVLIQSPTSEILLSNPKALELLGLSHDQLLGRTSMDPNWNVVHEDGSPFPGPTHPVPQAIATRLPVRDVVMGVFRPATQDRVWLLVTALPELQPDGSVRQVVCTFSDITDRKQIELERSSLEAQFQRLQKMESLGRLAGGIGHEMNNALGAILGLSSAHLTLQPEATPAFQAFDTIAKAATRAGKLVKNLLTFARQDLLRDEVLDLNAILREEVRILEHTPLGPIRIHLDLATDLRSLRGDESALAQAILNLFLNAVDAMPKGGTLSVRSRNEGPASIEVCVEDTGAGMAEEVLAKALDPFFTTKEVGQGTGLGLAMVHTTVLAHQGQLDLRSEPGRGTTVTLRFPACEALLSGPAAPPAPPPATAPRTWSVLLVDDDEILLGTLELLMDTLGHKSTGVQSGEAALAELEAGFQPDVVFLDMNMPGLGGAETLPRLRALRPTLPVVLCTGRVDQTALDLVAAHPLVTLLGKPFGIKELRQQLEALGREG